MRLLYIVSVITAAAFLHGCETTGGNTAITSFSYKKPVTYNFKFIGYDPHINNPDNDRLSFYKVYVNRADEGRTTTGLESQRKELSKMLPINRHQLVVEKWTLDQAEKRYQKLNNVHQPKPAYYYFDVPDNKIIVVTMKTDSQGRAEYSVEFEKNK